MTVTLLIYYILTIFSIGSGILTIIKGKNPINSVVYLVSCFGNSALIFMLMGVDLLGFIYIIVYVGAIAILFIFVIMMMDLRFTTHFHDNSVPSNFPASELGGRAGIPFVFSSNLPLILLLLPLILSSFIFFLPDNFFSFTGGSNLPYGGNEIINNIQENQLDGLKILFQDFTTWEIANFDIWEDSIQNSMNNLIQVVGYLLLTDFLTTLLLASLILLMVMISVITLILSFDNFNF